MLVPQAELMMFLWRCTLTYARVCFTLCSPYDVPVSCIYITLFHYFQRLLRLGGLPQCHNFDLDLSGSCRLRYSQLSNSKRIDAIRYQELLKVPICKLTTCASITSGIASDEKRGIMAQIMILGIWHAISSLAWSKQLSCGRWVYTWVLDSASQH